MPPLDYRPRTFFLNEQHELSPGERDQSGRTPTYAPIDWKSRGSRLSASLKSVQRALTASVDPVKTNHYFVLTKPQKEIVKLSENKKLAPDGMLREPVRFNDQQSRVFNRLEMDLLQVRDDGSAIVHLLPTALEKLARTTETLDTLGPREQARWVAFDEFQEIPSNSRIDDTWLKSLERTLYADAVIEFQPFLSRAEIDALLRSIVAKLKNAGERIHSTGSDFSGRQWLRGAILPDSLHELAESFFSIQSLHAPLIAQTTLAATSAGSPLQLSGLPLPVGQLPVIGVVDTGVPQNHIALANFRRGTYIGPNSQANNPDPHGTFVTSRVVFDESSLPPNAPGGTPQGNALFYDINICGINEGEIDTKSVYPALLAITSTAPDVRVFNCSFDTIVPLPSMNEVDRSEYLNLVRDLDNFIFQNDIIVVFSAGNSYKGIVPQTPYPNHCDEAPWQFGAWARSFNSLTCGSFVGSLSSDGIVGSLGWPSPFCRVGPGLCDSFKPDFSHGGGNSNAQYSVGPGLGVWGLTQDGLWKESSGTSFAAPLLSRECAFALQALQQVCAQGTRPFAVTVKAFLALTAIEPQIFMAPDPVLKLAKRTLGHGQANARRLWSPDPNRAVMIWQGFIENQDDIARIEIPIPIDWLKQASEPHLRIAVASDPPTNSALAAHWATRKISCRVRPESETRALTPKHSDKVNSYPLFQRTFKIPKDKATNDVWIVELSYEILGDYYPVMNFSPRQRVAFAAELIDLGPTQASPQLAIQNLASSATMNRLSVSVATSRVPVLVRAAS